MVIRIKEVQTLKILVFSGLPQESFRLKIFPYLLIQKKEEELKTLEMKINNIKTELEGNSVKGLIVKETDFLGISKS
ncbi:hypothetical protein [Chryseobacterium sp. KMC2]|uniref:hypothetical protein n=1 Tax=Chryseobacterium sp. KMC2 TaxID=2800705 RepID=UPI001921EADD|nr:hypothetical protein [Chryseobacterium sp. KMC2]MBL3547239.1 hypothetical protein [Chryseobacterium sp. KMC2]